MFELTVMVCVGLVCAMIIHCQREHNKFLERKEVGEHEAGGWVIMSDRIDDLEKQVVDIKDLQKRVDVLTLKAGFKL